MNFKRIGYVLFSTFMGLWGGQRNKGVRRFGIPGLAFTASLKNFSIKNLSFLLLIHVLTMGYGENSWLTGVTHGTEWLTRFIYGGLLSIPFLFWGIKRFLFAFIFLVAAFQIHAGSLGHIGTFDILVEDFLRYSTLSILISYTIFKQK